MANLSIVLFAFLLIVAVAFAAETCSKIGQHCYTTEDCCKGLLCHSYLAKCVSGGPLGPQ
ncbi:omega-conotoxin-like protein 1 [Nasonia vitripennis]|uniref:Uncharacterized protein n=1 Tax=Nasonia vitripennis TaxID=7425 RepID=A0A7M7IWL3_NASVI|nr:omega-conotoxin-like protein 1 [Nasonia vitripennis]